MSKKLSLLKFEIFNTIFILLLGTLLHFTFKWSNNNLFVGIFSSVNESTWEHLKLIFFPMLITALVGQFYFKISPNYLCIKTKAIIIGLIFTIVFFYTYTGILGTNLTFLDIGTFILAVLISQYYAYKKVKSSAFCDNFTASIVLLMLLFYFIIFTFFPLHIGLFKDPLTCKFGI